MRGPREGMPGGLSRGHGIDVLRGSAVIWAEDVFDAVIAQGEGAWHMPAGLRRGGYGERGERRF